MLRRIDSVLADPRFARELAQADLIPRRAAAAGRRGIVGAAAAAVAGEPLSGLEEAVVLLQSRPSLLIRKNRCEVPQSGSWADVLAAQRALVEKPLPSVGRIEVDDGAGFRHVGTGWVIAEKVIATNRHVAEIFASRQAQGIQFLSNFMGLPYRARIDFREEYQEQARFEVAVKEVVFMEAPERSLPDIAFLRLVSHEGLPDPIPLVDRPLAPGAMVAVIGYPAYDPRYGLDAAEAAKAIFGTIYDVKRLSPGCVMGEDAPNWFFAHDATTLGGNSGSVVLDMATGYAIGMHFLGDFRNANYAVKAATLLEYARQNTVGVLVRQALPPAAPSGRPEGEGVPEAAPESYANRQGYQEGFLGGDLVVPLPQPGAAMTANVLTFTDPATGAQTSRLDYTHYSVVMNRARRLCFYSAVNIDGKQSVAIKGQRPPWRTDPRIPKQHQIVAECYGREQDGKFSRGHMTRREDPDWGPEADQANTDTFHATNAVPQIQPFNAGIWNNLEDYALQNARQDDMRICVFTGPIFAEDDPVYFDVAVPVRFWKIIAFIHDQTGKLCATGYTMSQRDFLPGAEFVYGRFQTYQNSIAEIEGLTGLSFGELAQSDPFRVVEEAPPQPLRGLDQVRFA